MEFTLDFERPIVELRKRIDGLREVERVQGADLSSAISQLERQAEVLLDQIFSTLTPWQQTLLSRHPARPYSQDYIDALFTDWTELHGDRAGHEDPALIGGLARFGDTPVMVIGHQKGRNTKENIRRNFGMAKPDGYRKALRLMEMANRFGRPIFTFIDTPGAYPGIDAEERGQAEAIARNIMEMSTYTVPVICTVIGEGGSGGALAVGVGNRILMLENSVYSVISPEGCAAILWRDRAEGPTAAEALKITAADCFRLGVADAVVPEPKGGAHVDFSQSAAFLGTALRTHLDELLAMTGPEIQADRYDRFRKLGVFLEGTAATS
jgi:acetyl-CoA carboxylase carboxyl transferase subunit alpha